MVGGKRDASAQPPAAGAAEPPAAAPATGAAAAPTSSAAAAESGSPSSQPSQTAHGLAGPMLTQGGGGSGPAGGGAGAGQRTDAPPPLATGALQAPARKKPGRQKRTSILCQVRGNCMRPRGGSCEPALW